MWFLTDHLISVAVYERQEFFILSGQRSLSGNFASIQIVKVIDFSCLAGARRSA